MEGLLAALLYFLPVPDKEILLIMVHTNLDLKNTTSKNIVLAMAKQSPYIPHILLS